MDIAEEYMRVSVNIPKALLEVQQHIHGSIDKAAYCTYKAEKEIDKQTKIQYINQAMDEIFFLFSRIDYLVKTKGITIGQANLLLDKMKLYHDELKKWFNYLKKEL